MIFIEEASDYVLCVSSGDAVNQTHLIGRYKFEGLEAKVVLARL